MRGFETEKYLAMTDLNRLIGQRLRKCREARGWTLEEAVRQLRATADGSPVGTTGMNMWELGERTPRLEAFLALSKIYNRPASFLAGLDSDDHAPDYIYPMRSPSAPGLLLDSTLADDSLAVRAPFLTELGVAPSDFMVIRMPDDGMADTAIKGDLLLLDLSKRDAPAERDMFALLVNGRIWVRWIRPEMDDSYSIASDDPVKYPDQKVSADELQKFQIIGRVVMATKRR